MNELLRTTVELITSPQGITLTGYLFVVITKLYTADKDLSDFDFEAFGVDVDFDMDSLYVIPLVGEFSPSELTVILFSLYYQYSIIRPQTGLQSLLTSISSLILFGIFMDHIVDRYMVSREN